MFRLAMVQGRLSSEVAGKYQYFPIHNWKQEFTIAKKMGFDSIEWIVSDFSNPIFNPDCQNEIIEIVNSSNIEISSISLDLLMPKTLNLFSTEEFEWIFSSINKISKEVKLSRVSIPIEETSGIRDAITLEKVIYKLEEIVELNLFNDYLIAIETDMSPLVIEKFLVNKKFVNFGILLDTGNCAAYGYKLEDYFTKLKDKIFSIHIKDRLAGLGPSVPLGQGAAEFKYLKTNIKSLHNLKDITLQTFKTNKTYERDLILAKQFVKKNIL